MLSLSPVCLLRIVEPASGTSSGHTTNLSTRRPRFKHLSLTGHVRIPHCASMAEQEYYIWGTVMGGVEVIDRRKLLRMSAAITIRKFQTSAGGHKIAPYDRRLYNNMQ